MEEWKDVKGYEGHYKVSNLGRIKSFKYYLEGKLLKTQIDWDGYETISLTLNKKSKKYKVHRLVAQAFIPNPDNLLEINHKDKNKLNNNVKNLEWCTRKYNCLYSYEDIYKSVNFGKKYRKFGGIYIPVEILNKKS